MVVSYCQKFIDIDPGLRDLSSRHSLERQMGNRGLGLKAPLSWCGERVEMTGFWKKDQLYFDYKETRLILIIHTPNFSMAA